jgi:TldD protein
VKYLDVGRYDTLCDAKAVADLVSKTIGRATEIDTAFGFEANAGGTGFIDPIDMLGSYRLGSALLNVSGDRSAEGSVGRVRWDDEGVQPVKVDLIRDGIVTNMQCNREGAALVSEYFKRTGHTAQSHGCAYTPTAMDVPMVHNMDLSMQPGTTGASLDNLRKGIRKGVELQAPYIDVDFQCVTGLTYGTLFEIQGGKRVARYDDGSIIFRTPELWNNLVELGGTESIQRFGLDSRKGQPVQTSAASVFSVPAMFKELTVMRTK